MGAGVRRQGHAERAKRSAGGTEDILINRYMIQKGLDRQLVLYWYQAHGRVVASEYWGKFYLIADAFRLNRTDGALVRVIAPVGPGEQGEADAEESRGQVRAVAVSAAPELPADLKLMRPCTLLMIGLVCAVGGSGCRKDTAEEHVKKGERIPRAEPGLGVDRRFRRALQIDLSVATRT